MSTGNPLVDSLDTLKAKVEALSAQVKAADPRAVLEAARSGAGSHGPELREATRQAQEAAQAAREAADLGQWFRRRLIIGSLLAAFLGGAVAGGIVTARWLAPMEEMKRAGPQWASANQQAYDAVMDLSGKVKQLAERVCPPAAQPVPAPQSSRSKRRE